MKILIPILLLIMLSGCDTDSSKTPEQIQAEIAASQKKFALEQQRIEQEAKARETKLAEQRSFIRATFISVDSNRIEVSLSNLTNKPIDNHSGSLEVFDLDDNYVTGIALTNWVPGDIYLPVGGSTRAIKSLDLETAERREQIMAEAPGYRYHFTIHRIQFEGEDEISFMQTTATTENKPKVSAIIKEPEPVNPNQASPEPCGDNQLSIETEQLHYPGPKCSHIERNIDSERFKQEYIRLCQTRTGAESAPASAASVQISSCMNAPGGQGIVYTKRICCNLL
jgi:hypothetical protein